MQSPAINPPDAAVNAERALALQLAPADGKHFADLTGDEQRLLDLTVTTKPLEVLGVRLSSFNQDGTLRSLDHRCARHSHAGRV